MRGSGEPGPRSIVCVCVCAHACVCSLWLREILARLFLPKMCGLRALPESGVWPQRRCLGPPHPAPIYGEEMGAQHAGPTWLGGCRLRGLAIPPLWGWLCETLMIPGPWRQQESEWQQQAIFCVFLALAQAFPLSGKPVLPCPSQPCDKVRVAWTYIHYQM